MKPGEDSEFLHWPEVPEEQRPKKVYHRGLIKPEWAAILHNKGWDPIDVRLLPNATDTDRAEALKAWLEGIRYGTIEADPKQAKWLELEARVYGLHAGKGIPNASGDKKGFIYSDGAIDVALDFGKGSSWSSSAEEKATATKKRAGRRFKDSESSKE